MCLQFREANCGVFHQKDQKIEGMTISTFNSFKQAFIGYLCPGLHYLEQSSPSSRDCSEAQTILHGRSVVLPPPHSPPCSHLSPLAHFVWT